MSLWHHQWLRADNLTKKTRKFTKITVYYRLPRTLSAIGNSSVVPKNTKSVFFSKTPNRAEFLENGSQFLVKIDFKTGRWPLCWFWTPFDFVVSDLKKWKFRDFLHVRGVGQIDWKGRQLMLTAQNGRNSRFSWNSSKSSTFLVIFWPSEPRRNHLWPKTIFWTPEKSPKIVKFQCFPCFYVKTTGPISREVSFLTFQTFYPSESRALHTTSDHPFDQKHGNELFL